MSFRLSHYHVASERLSVDGQEESRLVYATRTGKMARFPADVYDNIKAGNFAGLGDDTLSRLFALELIVPQDENEFATILNRNRVAVANNQALSVTIQPTADCQLGCSYCGQTHKKKNASKGLGDKIVSRIMKNIDRGGYKLLSVMWFGAEPLMAYSEILRVSDALIEECAKRGVQYEGDMVTNGLSLKPTVFRELSKRHCRHFQITVDGTALTHDRLRMTKTGLATFDLIMKNIVAVTALEEFKKTNSGITVRMNINKTSAHEVPALIAYLAERDLHNRGVILDFKPVIEWGGNGASANSYTADEYARLEIEWFLLAQEAGFKFPRFLPDRLTQPCLAIHPDGEVYDADGNVYPCYEFAYTEASSGPEYKLGHIDTIEVSRNDTAVTREWNKQIEGDVSPCKRCNLFPVCGGACPKRWLHGERACPSFKENIQDRLALHFIQKTGGTISKSNLMPESGF